MADLEPRNFLQPLLLLLLRERADHGYELAARMRPMHDGDGDAGGIYRALRGLERQGLVRSQWHTSDIGPARRIYRITPEGLACLEVQVRDLERVHEVLHTFLKRYAHVVAGDRPTGADRPKGTDRLTGAVRPTGADRLKGTDRPNGAVRPTGADRLKGGRPAHRGRPSNGAAR